MKNSQLRLSSTVWNTAGAIPGFTLSYEKTSLYRMGSIHGSNAQFYTQGQMAWTNDPIYVLGIKLGYGDITTLNFEPLIDKTGAVLQNWMHRGLSLIGKVTGNQHTSSLAFRLQNDCSTFTEWKFL